MVGMVTSVLTRAGFLFCIVPWIYLTVAWVFSVPLAAEKNLPFWPAMELSRRAVSRVWFSMCLLMLIAFLPTLIMHAITEVKIFIAMTGFIREEKFSTLQPTLNQLFPKMQELLRKTAEQTMTWALITKGVLLVNLPFALCALMQAYDELFGPKKERGA